MKPKLLLQDSARENSFSPEVVNIFYILDFTCISFYFVSWYVLYSGFSGLSERGFLVSIYG